MPPLRLRSGLVAAGLALLAGCGGTGEPGAAAAPVTAEAARADVARFRSAPRLRPPRLDVRRHGGPVAPGLNFLAPRKGRGQDGVMIADSRGRPVWFRPVRDGQFASDFRVQRYRGEPVLTWWQGRGAGGGGNGVYVVLDSRYEEVARVRATVDEGDLHEFQLTDAGTALFTIYRTVPYDLSPHGGPADGEIVESVIQEVDVATGELVLEWRSLEEIPPSESLEELQLDRPWDYLHANSIDVGPDGDLLVSARNTHAVYKLDRETGDRVWTLGGKASDFAMRRGTRFAWAHDARWQPDGTLTIFDNASSPRVRSESRGLVLDVDERRRRVRLLRAYTHPRELITRSQGGMQVLPNGNVLLSWGVEATVSEHRRDGRLVWDAVWQDEDNDTYRAYRFPWRGRPAEPPVVASRGERAWASWNGATGVRAWRVLAGPSPDRLEPGDRVPRRGFETALPVPRAGAWIAVEALGRGGRVLGTSEPVRR